MAIELARQMAGVGRGRSESSQQKSSAEALELESDDKRSILSDIAAEAQDFERRIARMFLQLKEGEDTDTDDLVIAYSEDFDVRGFEADVQRIETEKEEMRKAELDSLTNKGNTAREGPPNGNPKPQGGRPPGPEPRG